MTYPAADLATTHMIVDALGWTLITGMGVFFAAFVAHLITHGSFSRIAAFLLGRDA